VKARKKKDATLNGMVAPKMMKKKVEQVANKLWSGWV